MELHTERLLLRPICPDDAAFYLALVNTERWLTHIGDKGLRTVEAARESIVTGPMAMRAKLGLTLWTVRLRDDPAPLGICGLFKRDALPDVDIGYGYLPAAWGRGIAIEAALPVLAHARDTLRLPRLLGLTSPTNTASMRLLEKLGLRFEGVVNIHDDGSDTRLYAIEFEGPGEG